MSGHFAGGSLKLKGGSNAGISKKYLYMARKHRVRGNDGGLTMLLPRKKKRKSKSQKVILHSDIVKSEASSSEPSAAEVAAASLIEQIAEDQPPTPRQRQGQTKTPAEIKFEEIQRQRQQDRISKTAALSHKERVAEFNKYLEGLSEHYDIPKVGPG